MKPNNLRFYGENNAQADVYYSPDQSWGGVSGLTKNGLEFATSAVLLGLPSNQVGLDAQKFLVPVESDLYRGLYTKAEISGSAVLALLVNDPREENGRRVEPVVNDCIIELAPLSHQVRRQEARAA